MADNDTVRIYKNRYKIDQKLGAGNFATTYRVIDLEAKNELKALKVVRLGEMDSVKAANAIHEVGLLSSLNDEHIVKFYESFLENDRLYIITEYCEGGSLDRHLRELKKQNQTLEEDQVIEWLIQILLAVQYMHKSRILHRDLKAKTIFFNSNQIKIANFSMSRISLTTTDLSITFTELPCYMSPEVMKHNKYESKSDIWSIGCLLYEMCTYQHAFDGKGLMNVIHKVVEGKPPELPKTYTTELNNLLKQMFMKDPKNRPSAVQLLQTPFITRHRERTKLTGPLENTINANVRSRELSTRLQTPISYGQMQKQSWSISSKDYIADDSNDTEPVNVPLNQLHEEEEEEQLTLKPANTFKSTKQTISDKKVHDDEVNQNRLMMRETITIGSMRQPQSPPKVVEQARSKPINDASMHGNHDGHPITPLRASYRQIVDKFDDEDNSQHEDRSPTRERRSNESTLKSQRTMSASQRSIINLMSQPIDARHVANSNKQPKYASPSRTIGSATRQKPSKNTSADDCSAILKDNPDHDAFGPMAKNLKIDNLRTKAIKLLGKSTFEKVYDYLVKQRTAQKTDPNIDDAKIAQGLTAFVKKPADTFIVDQLIFLELI